VGQAGDAEESTVCNSNDLRATDNRQAVIFLQKSGRHPEEDSGTTRWDRLPCDEIDFLVRQNAEYEVNRTHNVRDEQLHAARMERLEQIKRELADI